MILEENTPNFHRPITRRLKSLTNEELNQLFKLRASKIGNQLGSHGFWDNNKIVYWEQYRPLLIELYEVMLEIQSRFPKDKVYTGKTKYLPVMEILDD